MISDQSSVDSAHWSPIPNTRSPLPNTRSPIPLNASALPRLQRALLRWYRRNARPFPWRQTRDPYRILVSEVMLQQTQASRVVPFYRAFIGRFPTVRALAKASPGSVLRAWQGLGYNMRALRLHATAVFLHRQFRGAFPSTVEKLLALPGIGPYTARAVAVFAFGRQEAVLDTNVRRVLRRWYPRSTDRTDFQALADRALARHASYDWNQAVMELGALVCTPAEPRCGICPIAQYCLSAGAAVRVFSKKKVHEQRYRGHPSRIYRGRVLKLLHASRPGRSLTDAEIARRLFVTPQRNDLRFVRSVVSALQRDGLVTLRTKTTRWMVAPLV